MKKISEVLAEIRSRPPMRDEVEFYTVINDPELDEPKVSKTILPQSELARSSSKGVMEEMLNFETLDAIRSWRAENYE